MNTSYLENSPYYDIIPQNLTQESITEFTELVLDDVELFDCGWRVKWNDSKRTFGECNYMYRTITLSKYIFENISNKLKMIDTALHEIAHAIDGWNPNFKPHGKKWQEIAIKLGATPTATDKIVWDKDKVKTNWAIINTADMSIQKAYHRKPNSSTFHKVRYWSIKNQPDTFGMLRVAYCNNSTNTSDWKVYE